MTKSTKSPTPARRAKSTQSTKYGQSPWVDAFPQSRRPSYPRHRGPLKTDVVIVGGGLTGCTTAYLCAVAGVKVALVEAGQVGQGSSGSSLGWIADDPGVGFLNIEKAVGRRAARHVWKSWHRAALDFGSLLRRLKLKCDLEPHGSLFLASTPEEMAALKREHKARRDGGLNAAILPARVIAGEVAMTPAGAIKSRDGFTLDPYRATLGLAAEAVKRGAMVFERSAARRITFSRKWVDVHTAGGVIRADHVIVATGIPTPLFKALVRHFWLRSAFLALTAPVPAKVRHQLGARSVVVRDSSVPAHVIRWLDDERLLVSGADGETPPERVREKLLEKLVVQRTGQLMYELSTMYPDISGILPSHGWEAAYARTADGLPYIGPHRNYPRHLFAFGDSSPSVTSAYLAARMLLRQILDESDLADEALGFNRYGHVR
jgi:glycine/D-amino acid oxidase-like deaminating enzyme